jgi:CspA family cold shock protein
MYRGRVKWFSPEKGFGFIELDPDKEVFVHHTAITGDGFHMLHAGEAVEFDLIDTPRGFQARNVRRLGLGIDDAAENPGNPEISRTS